MMMVKMSAVISDCRRYRYRLERHFAVGRTLMFVMANPSTADAQEDDQTIRKCVGFAERAGYGRIIVGNKFAWRSKDIEALGRAPDAIGPENDQHLREMMAQADLVVVAWGQIGKFPKVLRDRWKDIVRLADAADRQLHSIGVNRDGHPKHPQTTGYEVAITSWTSPWFPNRRRA
ncbi:DUF1643 domain-containing protein [Bradyrhizobium sp. USDA 4471]